MNPTRHRTLATIRACDQNPPHSGQVVYFVLCRFKSGSAWVERDITRTSRAATLQDIRSGELSDVEMVIETEFTPGGLSGSMHSRDVTEDIMAEAEQLRRQDREPIMSKLDRLLEQIDHDRKLRQEA